MPTSEEVGSMAVNSWPDLTFIHVVYPSWEASPIGQPHAPGQPISTLVTIYVSHVTQLHLRIMFMSLVERKISQFELVSVWAL